MISALSPVQAAVYAALTADATLMAELTGVFDDIPEGQAMPYVEIGEAIERAFRTFGRPGSEAVITLHVWDRPPAGDTGPAGFKRVQDIISRLNALLDAQSLPIPGHHVVMVLADDANLIRDTDGRTRHGIVRYRVITQEGGS